MLVTTASAQEEKGNREHADETRRRRRSKKTSKSEEKRKENYVTRQLVVAKSRGKISLKACYSSGDGVVAVQIIPNFSKNNTSDISKPSPGNPTKAKESLMFAEETK